MVAQRDDWQIRRLPISKRISDDCQLFDTIYESTTQTWHTCLKKNKQMRNDTRDYKYGTNEYIFVEC